MFLAPRHFLQQSRHARACSGQECSAPNLRGRVPYASTQGWLPMAQWLLAIEIPFAHEDKIAMLQEALNNAKRSGSRPHDGMVAHAIQSASSHPSCHRCTCPRVVNDQPFKTIDTTMHRDLRAAVFVGCRPIRVGVHVHSKLIESSDCTYAVHIVDTTTLNHSAILTLALKTRLLRRHRLHLQYYQVLTTQSLQSLQSWFDPDKQLTSNNYQGINYTTVNETQASLKDENGGYDELFSWFGDVGGSIFGVLGLLEIPTPLHILTKSSILCALVVISPQSCTSRYLETTEDSNPIHICLAPICSSKLQFRQMDSRYSSGLLDGLHLKLQTIM
ncbi:Aste57867_4429 [Aphanomyces stellatus]|uniref:Aste57867_4429 protein n=1 Tax=Aphanomyces stellatus TaxID=120398 RepID=A0A485KFW3_9STRA|nr:hypothetical protein As57867_004417 [Aphanomyces stellatus]VFT81540.1 Aste57867_4429 [Aphanomyces stellatus]